METTIQYKAKCLLELGSKKVAIEYAENIPRYKEVAEYLKNNSEEKIKSYRGYV